MPVCPTISKYCASLWYFISASTFLLWSILRADNSNNSNDDDDDDDDSSDSSIDDDSSDSSIDDDSSDSSDSSDDDDTMTILNRHLATRVHLII